MKLKKLFKNATTGIVTVIIGIILFVVIFIVMMTIHAQLADRKNNRGHIFSNNEYQTETITTEQ
jgi:small-conductance mechanosensitive channel